jgi:peptide chain release factor 2
MQRPGFWDDQSAAAEISAKHARAQRRLEGFRSLESDVADLGELAELAAEDEEMAGELATQLTSVERRLAELEEERLFSGPYDAGDAVVTINAGAGGTDSQDWAEMLLKMYCRWAESHHRPVQIMDLAYGDEAGLRSATLEIGGPLACGYLNAERGVHRLVRLSPYDPNHLRHTSFAQVEVLPAAVSEEETEITVRPEDLKMDFFHSSGPGGQNVQKVASAVRLTHLPTGIVVTCQTERSQHQNREYAMHILMARLLDRQNQERAEELAKLRGERISAEWGNQIRSYVLHPYKSVKDHRTNHQSTNPDAVLEGDLDDFIEAYLLSQLGE